MEIFLFRYFIHVIIVLAIIILVGGYFIFIKPTLSLLEPGGSLDAKVYETILSQEKTYLSKAEALDTDYKSLDQTKLDKLGYLVGSKLDEPSLLYLFQTINTQQGITPDSFTYTSDKGITQVKISFSSKDYFAFKDYLKTLEKSIRLMDVDGIQMSAIDGNYSIEVTTYYLE